MKIKTIKEVEKPTFNDVRDWYNKNIHPDANDYNDQHVYKNVYHEGRFAGVFQLTSTGAQKLFVAAKPNSIVDIAVLTSIYRPGPLAANVDKLYLKSKAGEKYEWGHPLFEKVLGSTSNLLIFQESVMDLAEHVGGFPKDQCDNVRRAIMKRDLSKGDAAKTEAKRLEDDFVTGAVKNGVPETTARKAYQNILWFAGYGFNKTLYTHQMIDIIRSGEKLTCQINEVKPGDYVPSKCQQTGQSMTVPVKKVHNNGVKPLVKVTLKDGREVMCSMNHRFRTTLGHVLSLAEIIRKGLSIETIDPTSHTSATDAKSV